MNEQVFISHSSLDEAWAGMIAGTLEKNGIRCWFDVHSIRPGDDYDEEIFKAIKRCPVFLLVLTENAVEATFVIKELGLAVREHKTIIPVKIGEFDLGKFWLKLENVQIYELGKSWNAAKMEVLTNEIKAKLDLVPVGQAVSRPMRPRSGGAAPWAKLAAAAAAVVLLAAVGFAVLKGGLIGTGTAGGEGPFGGGRDREDVVSPEPSGVPGENSDAVISTAPEASPDKPTKLATMHMMESDYAEIKENATNSVGQTCEDALHMYSAFFGPPYASYYLGGEYSFFTGVLSCPDEVGSGYTYTFQVCLDGNEDDPVFEIEMGRSTAPTPLEIDVSGCQTITFRTVGESAGAMISDGLLYEKGADYSPQFTAADAPPAAANEAKPMKLSKLHIMESDYAGIKEETVNSVGETHKDALYMYSAFFGPPYASYYLGGEYSLFTGTLSCPDEVGSGYTYTFQVCLDSNQDEPVFELEMGRSTTPTPLEIDVSGCRTITFRTVGESAGAMISDGLFTP